jgi:hypothetical protein
MEEEKVCPDCGGVGTITYPAHMQGDRPVDEETIKCHCQLREEEYDQDDE